MAAVMIGIDPHKASHTAVAIRGSEDQLGTLRVRAGAAQAIRLVEWAAAWPGRAWAVEGAGGLGHLSAQQLVAAGETVLDVQPNFGARVRLRATDPPPPLGDRGREPVALARIAALGLAGAVGQPRSMISPSHDWQVQENDRPYQRVHSESARPVA